MIEPASPAVPIERDGFLVDPETGEILGVVEQPQFRVMDMPSLEWVLKKLGEAEADIAAVDETAAVVHARAVIENAQALKDDLVRRRDGIIRRFESEVREFALKELEGKRTRTLKTLFGQVAFRRSAASLRIADPAKAAASLRNSCPKALRVKIDLSAIGEVLDADATRLELLDAIEHVLEFCEVDAVSMEPLISYVGAEEKALLMADPEAARASGFEVVPEQDKVSIETGVGR